MQVATNDYSITPPSTTTTTVTPLEPSKSSTTLAQRRRIPESAEKLKLTADHLDNSSSDSSNSPTEKSHYTLFDHDNVSSTCTKVCDDILLSHLERQQRILSQLELLESTTYQSIPLDSKPVIQSTAPCTSTIDDKCSEEQEDDVNDVAFWTQLVQDYTSTAQRYPTLLLTLLSKSSGVPNRFRGAIWQAMAQSNSDRLLAIYEDLAQQQSPGSSPFHAMIDHDVDTLYGRKFPLSVLDSMKKILKVYTLHDPQLDYSTACLSLLVPLLRYVSESQAFCLFVRLMELYEMRSMFIGEKNHVNAIKSRLFEILLGQFCPQLESHLDQHMIRSMHYAGQWYPNLLSSILPDDAITRIFDLVFALGAMETITRAGLALMQRSETQLLAIGDDSKLVLISVCTSKLFDLGYSVGGVDAFIHDTMACGTTISNEKLITMMDTLTSQTELQHELTKKMEQSSMMITTTAAALDQSKKKEKRDSWFSSWSSTPAGGNRQQQQQRSPSSSPQTQPLPATPTSPSSTTFNLRQNDRTIPLLHQQIEDLLTALSQLQKDHSQLSEEMMATRLHDMERQVEQSKLLKKTSTLEKKVKKYKIKLTQQQQALNNRDANSTLNRQDEQYQSFVQSLRLSGNFGALVAGALDNDAPPTPTKAKRSSHSQPSKRQSICSQTQTDDSSYTPTVVQKRDDLVKEVENTTTTATGPDNDIKAALHAVTSELVTVKLANFEMGQKYEQLCHKYNDMEQALTKAKQQAALQAPQIDHLVHQLEQSNREKDDFIEEQAAIWSEEQEALLQENEDWMDKVMAAKKTASELHMDKLDLMKHVERQEQRIQQLETEKRDYLMPRASFTEEVFATHNIFFGQQQQQQPSTGQEGKESAAALEEFRLKYVESDLRCRELEKLLAEAKVKVAEYESNSGLSSVASSICCSPRASLQQRASSLQMKRASTTSFLTASSITGQQQQQTTPSSYRSGTPTSPTAASASNNTTQSPSSSLSSSLSSSPGNNRLSNESCASSTTSVGSHGKRSSMYARICSSFSSVATPPTTKSPVLYEEPQSTV